MNTIGIPQQIYHDNEGSWSSKAFIRLLNFAKVKQIITSSPPPFAERMVQTIKRMIHTRLGGLEIDKQKWVELLPSVLNTYNNTKHSTTGMTPHMAKQSSNHVEGWLNIHNKAKFNRKYPPLKVGDSVRVYIKPKSFKKGYESAWSANVYNVVRISDDKKQFLVNDYTKRRVYSRHELLKIEGVEGKSG